MHRLRFTNDVFGKDWGVLLDLLQADGPARLQVWIDHGLVQADQSLLERIGAKCRESSERLGLTSPIHVLEGGERMKNDDSALRAILAQIEKDGLDRRCYVLAIGGGAFLDTVGFAAAIAHRGIRLIRIPTTTLAQADSGVGVKTAINAFGKKNWQGAFAVPWAVLNDQSVLLHLPTRDYRSGFSEAVKVSLLKSRAAFWELHQNASAIVQSRGPEANQAIRTSVLLHLQHITHGGDPFETREARPLDFGHWSAHKLESLSQYGMRHGEAVSVGVALDTVYSSLTQGLPLQVRDATLETLERMQLPIFSDWLMHPELMQGLEEFRQHLGGRLTITLLRELEDPVDVHQIDPTQMLAAIAWLRNRCSVAV